MEVRQRRSDSLDGNGNPKKSATPNIITISPGREKYEEEQHRLLELFEKDRQLLKGHRPRTESECFRDNSLAQASLLLNIVSLAGNLVASMLSGSLSVASTFVDSSMDISCSLIMNVCLRMVSRYDAFNYPRGRQRLELVGVLLCSFLMAFANISMILQAINNLMQQTSNIDMTSLTLLILIVQTLLKAVLCYLCYCRNSISSLVIAMDLRNDLVTRVLAIVCGVAGAKWWADIDSIGAIAVCSGIAYSWFCHAFELIPMLVGKRADREEFSRILNVILEHDSKIEKIDHVMVYYTSEKAIVEVHIVMNAELPLKITHDVSQSLEKKLKLLSFVERAFVHVDFECDGD